MDFKERIKLAKEALEKQGPVTIEQAKEQIEFLKSNSKIKKKDHDNNESSEEKSDQ